MYLSRWTITSAVALFLFVGVPPSASADWLLTPYIGVNWGGHAEFRDAALSYEQEFERRMNLGGSLVWQRNHLLGFEVDFGFAPDFFADTGNPDDYQFGDSTVTTLMANIKVDAPFSGPTGGGIRPYASGGIGLIRTNIKDPFDLFEVDSNDLGVNVGGGVAGFFSERFGLRGDVRYFRSLQDNDPDDELDLALGSFRFWRGTVGFIIRF